MSLPVPTVAQKMELLKLANQARHMAIAAAQAAEKDPPDLAGILSYGDSAGEAVQQMNELLQKIAGGAV